MLQVFVGFIPWILYWSFSGPGLWTIAILGGLIAAAALVTWRWFKRRDLKTMEIVTLGYFAGSRHCHTCIGFIVSKNLWTNCKQSCIGRHGVWHTGDEKPVHVSICKGRLG